MASLDKMREADRQSSPNKDVELAVRMTVKLLEEGGGLNVISKAIQQSQDPAQVIGQFLGQVVGQLAEKLDAEFGVDPRIFLASGGWLEKILDYIEGKLNLPPEFSDEVYGQVLEVIKAAAMGGKNPVPAPQPQGGGLQAMQPGDPAAMQATQGGGGY